MGWDLMINKCRDLLSIRTWLATSNTSTRGMFHLLRMGTKTSMSCGRALSLEPSNSIVSCTGLWVLQIWKRGDDDLLNTWCESPKYVSDSSEYPYFTAYNQLHAFFAWVHLCYDRMEMYCKFEVYVSFFWLVCDNFLSNPSHFLSSRTYIIP